MSEEQGFNQWAVVELFGHQVTAGKVTEEQIGGKAFVRVDVPAENEQPGFTKFYGAEAIYCLTPVSEEVARAAVRGMRPQPVSVYIAAELKQPALPSGNDFDPSEDEDDRPEF